ncbi:amine dehydrogenase [Rhizobium sp. ARZ01]|uniref:methylamine dehydrogenase light chain n=1 Tax=Rhizobium sp. ARZ01 TaxID=2769313 RepID=UPI00177B0305|nr:methylamine dehydrogenase light chain [Rhizobium sp. ARZ01]MBD9375434.1 amine dehydrogenase [Rhizobium sp. ARZ01]
MLKFINYLLTTIDKTAENSARLAARQFGRRSFLAKTGALLGGAALMPLLPYDRTLGAAYASETAGAEEGSACEYWRHCALDGALCNTSGGTTTSCPPGSQASSVSWVGTCHNPKDGKDYLVSYNDCCGKAPVNGATWCFSSKGERPGYRMGLYNDINWCMANENKSYHCTVAMLVGLADE